MSLSTAPFAKRMVTADEEEVLCKDVLLEELYNRSSNSSERSFFVNNEETIKELIHVLRTHKQQSLKALQFTIESVSNLSKDAVLLSQMTKLGVCSPLVRLLHSGPEEVQTEVSLCLYQLHAQSTKNQHAPAATTSTASTTTTSTTTAASHFGAKDASPRGLTIDSFIAHDSVMQASIPPLLRSLQPAPPSPSASSSLQSAVQRQEAALEALQRYTMRHLHLTATLLRHDAIQCLVPLLFSGEGEGEGCC
jgi:hypothetical protein